MRPYRIYGDTTRRWYELLCNLGVDAGCTKVFISSSWRLSVAPKKMPNECDVHGKIRTSVFVTSVLHHNNCTSEPQQGASQPSKNAPQQGAPPTFSKCASEMGTPTSLKTNRQKGHSQAEHLKILERRCFRPLSFWRTSCFCDILFLFSLRCPSKCCS